MRLRKLSLLLTCLLAAAVLITANAISVEAKGKKKKAVASSAKSKKSKTVRSKSSRRSVAKRSKRSRARRSVAENYRPDPSPAIVPDRIEVLEFGSANSTEFSKLLSPSQTSNQSSSDVGTITPSRKVNIDVMRVIQIQQALTAKGFYSGETSGNYDQATIEAMRRFQSSNKISATGYPTAHALKRLGLASW
ncbi:MAG: peptidoglycan-binding domain-containing protein [Acidobacteriota bacterium]